MQVEAGQDHADLHEDLPRRLCRHACSTLRGQQQVSELEFGVRADDLLGVLGFGSPAVAFEVVRAVLVGNVDHCVACNFVAAVLVDFPGFDDQLRPAFDRPVSDCGTWRNSLCRTAARSECLISRRRSRTRNSHLTSRQLSSSTLLQS